MRNAGRIEVFLISTFPQKNGSSTPLVGFFMTKSRCSLWQSDSLTPRYLNGGLWINGSIT